MRYIYVNIYKCRSRARGTYTVQIRENIWEQSTNVQGGHFMYKSFLSLLSFKVDNNSQNSKVFCLSQTLGSKYIQV